MKFATGFILIYPLYTIMFGDRGGVSAAGIGVILAVAYVLSVAFEIPTGIIGDKFPRKYVLTAAVISQIGGLLAWLLLPSFAGYIFAAVLFALSSALESGALQAYLYGILGENSQKNFGKFWARVNALVMVSYTSSNVVASLVGVNYPLLIILSIVSCVFALAICLSLPKDNILVDLENEKPRIFRSAIAHIMQSKKLIKLLLSAVIVVAIAEVMIEFISLYYNQVGITTRYVPLLMGLGNIIGAVLFWTLHSWEKFLDKHKLILMIFMTTILIASFFGGTLILCAGILIYTRFIRVLQVQFESSIQHLSNEKARVTISSIGSFGAKLSAAGIVTLVGIFAVDNKIVQPLQYALVIGSLLFIGLHLFLRYRD